MTCPLCGQRKAKRACPAMGRQICAVCCGTKRLVEIRCPADCGYLAAAQVHPPVVIQRQQARDRELLLPMLRGLTERQARLFLMLAAAISRHQDDPLRKIIDDDIAQAAGALAETLETAGRGIVYEPQPASLPAARLMADLKTMLAELSRDGGSGIDRDAGIALRRIETGARDARGGEAADGQLVETDAAAFRQLLSRVLVPAAGGSPPDSPTPASSLIIP